MSARSLGRLTSTVACATVLLMGAAFAYSAGAASVPPSQRVVAMFAPHKVRAKPGVNSKVVARVKTTRPITGMRTKLPVLATKRDAKGRLWLQVRTPGRAIGEANPPQKGYRAGQEQKEYSVVIGAPSTPTPNGEFFVEESVKLPKSASGAPYALALSARSSVFQEFEGGPAQVAIHGRDNVGGTLGTAVSHGCVRASTSAVTWLSRHIGQGVPVTISK
ncbi:MAG: L,D-transpeptidase [Solirubrobacterales bacterium]|nr:L,D-transpeptidase [Solirubrobacterales bacterium]